MSRIVKFLFIGIGALSLIGCESPQPYPFKPGEPKAKIKLVDLGSVDICKDSQYYYVPREENKDFAYVPAGNRITIGRFLYFEADYGTIKQISRCYPRISFVPKAGRDYYAHVYLNGETCIFEITKQDKSKANDMTVEPSIGPLDCYQKQKPEESEKAEHTE